MDRIEKPLVYLILGAAHSGRRDLLLDLIAGGLEPEDRVAVLISDDEEAAPADAKLPNVARWTWNTAEDNPIVAELPRDATRIFFLTDGRQSPVDQTEHFKTWLAAQGADLARVLCVVDCQLAEKNPPLLAWYEACVHFADVVLLNKRDGVANKWLTEFLTHFKKLYYPCLFELVKHGHVPNALALLVPEARRMTHVFDEEQNWIFTNAEGEEIDEQEETEDDEEEIEAKPEEDPYFERRMGGRRVKQLPDIATFLPEPAS
jgi:hypothetical protein